MSASKCKRGATSSDDDSPRTAPSPTCTGHVDDDVSSPGSSSTLSGSSVVHLPGFTQHSHQTLRRPRMKKKRDDATAATDDILCTQTACTTRHQLTPRTKGPRGTVH